MGDVSSVGDEVMAALPSPRRLAAVSAGGVARLGGLLLLEPGADPDALDAALVGLGLDSLVDRIVVTEPAASSTDWERPGHQ
ncbi:MAG: hypothetical protein M3535_00460 [Actinomycetota bacterium]|nr:hypothetical protein [Actinomycetota bacterium]